MTGNISSLLSRPNVRCRLIGLLCATLAMPAAAAGSLGIVAPDRWRPHADVGVLEHVTLRIHWYDSLERLREAAIGRDVEPGGLHGFSILTRNTQSGEWVCDVFVVKMRGTLVDNDRTMTFGHEVLHCFGFRHD